MITTRVGVVLALSLVSLAASADCFDDAAAFHGVNSWVLRAMTVVETGGCRGQLVSRNSNGSVDIGCTQTNSVHFPELGKFGVHPRDLMDPCNSIHVAGWLLRKKMIKHGNNWTAVGAFHSETPRHRDTYAGKVRAVVDAWRKRGIIK